jgi:CHAT domain-containing protein
MNVASWAESRRLAEIEKLSAGLFTADSAVRGERQPPSLKWTSLPHTHPVPGSLLGAHKAKIVALLAKVPELSAVRVREEIGRCWDLKTELVNLSVCETTLGRDAGGEGFLAFTHPLLMSGARSVCLSLWNVDVTATALLIRRIYHNALRRRRALTSPLPKAAALREAKTWLRGLCLSEVLALTAELSGGVKRGKGAEARRPAELASARIAAADNDRPNASPYYWAAFVLVGDTD